MLEFTCPHCGKTLDLGEKYTATTEVCDGCGKSVWTPAMPPPPPPAGPGEDEYEQDTEANTPGEGAGFWRRVGATDIDYAVLFVCIIVIQFLALLIVRAIMMPPPMDPNVRLKIIFLAFVFQLMIYLGVPLLYFAVLESSSMQASLGKRLLRLRVTRADGGRLSFWRAMGRNFLKFTPLGFGILVAAGKRKQALHDIMVDCFVVRDKALPGAPAEYGGFWTRFVAMIFDGMAVCVGLYLVIFPIERIYGDPEQWPPLMHWLPLLAVFVGTWLYFSISESSTKQATFGKWLVGLYVTDSNGRRISFVRATARYFGKLLSVLPLFTGFFMAGLTKRKQALHDIMANSLVMRY